MYRKNEMIDLVGRVSAYAEAIRKPEEFARKQKKYNADRDVHIEDKHLNKGDDFLRKRVNGKRRKPDEFGHVIASEFTCKDMKGVLGHIADGLTEQTAEIAVTLMGDASLTMCFRSTIRRIHSIRSGVDT